MSRQLSDWLEYYMKYTQRTEPPELYHLWSGLTAISSALRRKCYCNWGALRGLIYPNMFVSLVGPPGGRKGTAMRIAKSFVQNLEIPLGADSLGSTQALYKELMDSEDSYIDPQGITRKHKSVSIWAEEFQVFLTDKDQMLIPSLTDLFDCANVWKYKTLARKTEDISNVWITIIGAITPDLLQAKLSHEAVGGGLISRIIFVVGQGPKQRKALQFLTEEEEEIQQMLENDLQEIANLSGQFTLSKEFLKAYVRWYEHEYDESGVPSDKFLGYNHRRPLHINKVCMLLSASESNGLIITTDCQKPLRLTRDHLVFTSAGLIKAGNIHVDDILYNGDDQKCKVKSIDQEHDQSYFGLNCLESEVLANDYKTSTFGHIHYLPATWMSIIGYIYDIETASSWGDSIVTSIYNFHDQVWAMAGM